MMTFSLIGGVRSGFLLKIGNQDVNNHSLGAPGVLAVQNLFTSSDSKTGEALVTRRHRLTGTKGFLNRQDAKDAKKI
jgi:hypothetical protein